MDSIVIGRYLPLDSPMHRLDPRTKIFCMLLFIVAIFLPTGYWGYLVLGVLVISMVLIAKISITYIVKAMKPMLLMLIFLLVINVLVVRTGPIMFTIGGFSVYRSAVSQTLYIVIRLALMISVTTILTATTKPLDMTLGIEDILIPFKRFGVPAHEIAMMISIALRFIPTLIEETQRIMKAQESRGVDFNEGKLMEKIRGILSLIVPLFISAFQRAEDLANAMEARGYIPNRPRTRYKQLKFKVIDFVAIVLTTGLTIAMIVWAVMI